MLVKDKIEEHERKIVYLEDIIKTLELHGQSKSILYYENELLYHQQEVDRLTWSYGGNVVHNKPKKKEVDCYEL